VVLLERGGGGVRGPTMSGGSLILRP